MAWQHPRTPVRIAVYDVDGDEASFCTFMECLSKGTIFSEPETIRPALERYFSRDFTITVSRRAAVNGDDIWDVRPIARSDARMPHKTAAH